MAVKVAVYIQHIFFRHLFPFIFAGQFFLFINGSRGWVNVVYLRKGGNYRLIQPVLE